MKRDEAATENRWARIEDLARAVVDGSSDAWPRFWELLEPELKAWSAQPAVLGRLSGIDDARDAVCLRCMDNLHRDGFRRLRMYFEGPRAQKSFASWLRTVVKNTATDYIRSHEEYDRRRQSQGSEQGRPRGWRERLTLDTGVGMGARRPAFTGDATAKELLAFARAHVSERNWDAFMLWDAGKSHREIADELGCGSAEEARVLVAPMLKVAALEMWLEGASFADIGEELRLEGAAEAEKLVNAAKEQLRRHVSASKT